MLQIKLCSEYAYGREDKPSKSRVCVFLRLPNGVFVAVESYMLRSDPTGSDVPYDGFVVFDQPILGVIFAEARLNNTDDLLGRPGVDYNDNNFRGLEAGDEVTDMVTISEDRFRLEFHYQTGGWTDDVRIITAVPEPGSIAMLALGVCLSKEFRTHAAFDCVS